METITVEKSELKKLIRETVEEILESRKDIIENYIEDLIFGKMIKQGLKTKSIYRDEIFKVLTN